ncbi:MAG: Mor transcription activator family protein [Gallionellaceae bacterium]|nr:Mor transcription activator family protein [Gallionellaceae bacterium]
MNAEIKNLSAPPRSLQQIVDAIGMDAALVLVAHYGGIRLYVPLELKPGHPLIELLGEEAAQKLCRAFGGDEHFDIPLNTSGSRAERNRRIRERRCQGLSHSRLAREFKTTERNIRNILGVEVDDRQGGLF